MSLDLTKLKNVRRLENGVVQARCPACAEGGKDATGNHLRIQADGRFGCCVHPKDSDHRKRIFALVGDASPKPFTVRVKVAKPATEQRSVKSALTGFAVGTGGTGKTNSEMREPVDLPLAATPNGTFGTPNTNPYTYESISHMYKESESAVPSVLAEKGVQPPPSSGEKLPYLTPGGTLVIPFDSPERYHWWKPDGERMTVAQTMEEVKERVRATLATHERNELCP